MEDKWLFCRVLFVILILKRILYKIRVKKIVWVGCIFSLTNIWSLVFKFCICEMFKIFGRKFFFLY